MDKLFMYFIIGAFGVAAIKILTTWSILKLTTPSTRTSKRNTEIVRTQAAKVSAQFNQLLKARVLTRDDILIIRKTLEKYACRSYKNDAELIYSVLKHANVRMNELGSLEVFLESKRIKAKC